MEQDGPSAADLVNRLSEAALADILFQYGEERASRRIARALVEARRAGPIETTGRLAEIIGATVLAGELSLAAAVATGDWVTSHEQYGRNR